MVPPSTAPGLAILDPQQELLLGEADHVEGQHALRGLAAQPLSVQARVPDGHLVALAQRAVYQAEPTQYLALGIKQDVVTQNTDEGAGLPGAKGEIVKTSWQ